MRNPDPTVKLMRTDRRFYLLLLVVATCTPLSAQTANDGSDRDVLLENVRAMDQRRYASSDPMQASEAVKITTTDDKKKGGPSKPWILTLLCTVGMAAITALLKDYIKACFNAIV